MNFAFNRQALFSFFQLRFFRYLDKKYRSRTQHKLNHKNLFIFPTRKGWLYILVNLVLWLLGTNYQNNLVLALAFFMAALFVTCILQTYANLSRIKIRCLGASECFAGSPVDFSFSFSTSRTVAENIDLRFKSAEEKFAGLNLDGDEEVQIKIPMPTRQRGWLTADRLLIESDYPLGLLRCWTWLRFDTQALVFPEPYPCPEPKAVNIHEEGENERPIKGGEDYSGLHQYHAGDSLKHVAWKVFARGGGLHTKEFSQSVSREIWLDLSQLQGVDLEQKISGLCYWALEYERREENYGLNLPGVHLPPARGEAHRYHVLSALACFGLEQ